MALNHYTGPTPTGLTRAVASLILALSLVLIALSVVYFGTLPLWFGVTVILTSLSSAALAVLSLITGDPAWILLDLVLPG